MVEAGLGAACGKAGQGDKCACAVQIVNDTRGALRIDHVKSPKAWFVLAVRDPREVALAEYYATNAGGTLLDFMRQHVPRLSRQLDEQATMFDHWAQGRFVIIPYEHDTATGIGAIFDLLGVASRRRFVDAAVGAIPSSSPYREKSTRYQRAFSTKEAAELARLTSFTSPSLSVVYGGTESSISRRVRLSRTELALRHSKEAQADKLEAAIAEFDNALETDYDNLFGGEQPHPKAPVVREGSDSGEQEAVSLVAAQHDVAAALEHRMEDERRADVAKAVGDIQRVLAAQQALEKAQEEKIAEAVWDNIEEE